MSGENKKKLIGLMRIAAVLLVVIAGAWVFQSNHRDTTVSAEEETKDQYLTFVDHNGKAVSDQDFLGSFALVFFGYTQCPDVCPTGLSIIGAALDELGETSKKVQPLFITFDPGRDTPEVMADYVQHFHPRLIGLTGSQNQIARAVKSYGTYAEKIEFEEAEGEYLISHTAEVYFLGPDGEGLVIFEHGTDPTEMANTIRAHVNGDNAPSS